MLKFALVTLIAAAILQTPAQPGSQLTTSAVIDKVVFEPDDQSPERVQVWGTFNSGSRGFLYLQLPPYKQEHPGMMLIKSEWSKVRALAGTGTAVQLQSSDVLPLHPETDWPVPPAIFPRGLRAIPPREGLNRDELIDLLRKLQRASRSIR